MWRFLLNKKPRVSKETVRISSDPLFSAHVDLLDPRYLIIAAQALFIFIGIEFLSFGAGWLEVGLVFITAVFAEWLFANITNKSERYPTLFFPVSAVATAFGIVIFFRAAHPLYFVLAAAIAIASKYLIRVDGRHVFNPSNFSITTLAFTLPWATTIEFTQWGQDPLIYGLIAAICLFVSYRAGAIVSTLSFLFAYTVLLIPLVMYAPDLFSAHHYGLLGPALVIFAAFMLTEPRTTPSGMYARMLHGISVALLYFALEILGVRYAEFAALFLVSAFNNTIGKKTLPLLLRVAPWVREASNIGIAALSVAAFFTAAPLVFRNVTPVFGMHEISPQFLLFGIESSGVRSCAKEPVLARKDDAGFEHAMTHTYGAAWGDYDRDGFEDLYVSSIKREPSRLYRNNGDGTFSDVTQAAGLPQAFSSSAVFVDYDGDRELDLVVAHIESGTTTPRASPRVYKNKDGAFTDVTVGVGLADVPPTLGAAYMTFADYDRNGTIDFAFVSNGVILNPPEPGIRPFERSRQDPFYSGRRSTNMICGSDRLLSLLERIPDALPSSVKGYVVEHLIPSTIRPCLFFSSAVNLLPESEGEAFNDKSVLTRTFLAPGTAYLFKNLGSRFVPQPHFTQYVENILKDTVALRISQNERLPFVSGRFFQPASFDYDDDGLPDLFLATDFGRNLLLKNQGNMIFSDESTSAGIDYYSSGMGVAVSDWNRDGDADIVVTNAPQDYLFENSGDGTFKNRYAEFPFSVAKVGWGIAFLDYDLDGDDDIVTTNGLTVEYDADLDVVHGLIRGLFRTASAYRNDAAEGFVDDTGRALCPVIENGKALAVADYDNDGDEDIFFGTLQSGNALLENTTTGARSITVHLRGVGGNTFGIGARVSVTAGGITQTKYLMAGSSFGSQNSPRFVFGLGDSEAPAEILVRWPSGRETFREAQLTDKEVILHEL